MTAEQKRLLVEATRDEPEGMTAWARAVLIQAATRRRTEAHVPAGGAATRAAADEAVRFRQLADVWRAQTRLFSNVTRRVLHPAYQRIIGMGEAAVPLILMDLAEQGPDDWFWALTAITGENPIADARAGNMEAMTESWLQWGARAGYLNGYRPTSNGNSQTSGPTVTE